MPTPSTGAPTTLRSGCRLTACGRLATGPLAAVNATSGCSKCCLVGRPFMAAAGFPAGSGRATPLPWLRLARYVGTGFRPLCRRLWTRPPQRSSRTPDARNRTVCPCYLRDLRNKRCKTRYPQPPRSCTAHGRTFVFLQPCIAPYRRRQHSRPASYSDHRLANIARPADGAPRSGPGSM